jgi:ribonuclease PH
MLPRSTQQRLVRDREKLNGRTMEIQRLIGRSLRGAIHLEKLGPRQIILDCDVLQADGGTRSASITGGFVALWLACDGLVKNKILSTNPIKNFIGAISGGIYKDELLLDLDYQEDSITESDMNFILNDMGNLIEIQGTAEGRAFSWDMLHQLFLMASSGVAELIYHQKKTLGLLYD